ncbi:MAG: CapA family protein [Lactobacillales bacterium]|nr:CapA family protein [Lactobacillales bacterium]
MKKSLAILISVLAIGAGIFTGYLFTEILDTPNKTEVKKEEKKKEEVKKEPKVETYKASLFAVGDALIHDGVYIDANTYKKGADGHYIYDFSDMFTDIADIVKDYDLAFYNQETVIGGKNLGLSNYPCFNSPDEIGSDLVKIGFNMVNLSTNHTKDKGIAGIKYSANFWEKQENVYAVGSYTSKEKKEEAKFKTVNGINYAFLGYSTVTNGFTIKDSESYYWDLYDKEKVKNDIEKIKDKVDVIIVSMHWGTEYTHVPTQEEREIAKYLASLGVDIIIGHHPHVIQPIEYVDDTLVIYSLGNFISAQDGTAKRVGMMASLDINKTVTDGKTTSVTIDNVKGDLIWTYYRGYKNFKVIPFSKLNNNLLYGYQNIYNQYKPIINKTNDSRIQTGF